MQFNKALTPVIAVMLLLLITLGAVGTLYTLIEGQQEQVEGSNPDISLDVDALNIESCWYENGDTHLAIRNEGSGEINNSMIDADIDGSPQNIDSHPEGLINPQDTFEIEIDGEIDEDQQIELYLDGDSIMHRCFGIN